MDFKLSDKREKSRGIIERKLQHNEEEYQKLSKKLKDIEEDQTLNFDEKREKKLTIQIQMAELDKDDEIQNLSLKMLYAAQAREKLIEDRKSEKVDSKNFMNYKKKIEGYREFVDFTIAQNICEADNDILEMKIKLEAIRAKIGLISKEEADRNIEEFNKNISENESKIEDLMEFDLKKWHKDYHRLGFEGKQPTQKQLDALFDDFSSKYLEQNSKENENKIPQPKYTQQKMQSDKQISRRGKEQQIQDFNLELEHRDYDEEELAEKYSRHLEGEEKELAEYFALFQKENDSDEELQTIVEYEDSDGKKYYDVIYKDYGDNTGVVKTFEKIGKNTLKPYSENSIENIEEYNLENEYDEQKNFSIEDAKNRMKKSMIEDELGKGRVTEIAEITDKAFLNDFAKQTGQGDGELYNATIVVSVNEKGEEDFDIIFADYSNYKSTKNSTNISRIKSMPGIKSTEESGRNINTKTGMKIPLQDGSFMDTYETKKSLKEFETQDGHRYAITRDAEGKLCFDEIYHEQGKDVRAESVNTYTFEDFKETYKNANVTQSDLQGAYNTINRTKQQEQSIGSKRQESEGR